jgi:hypothetical protein
MDKNYENTGFYFLVLVAFVAFGFYYPYFSLIPHFPNITALIHVHALALMLWVVLLVVQPLLIRFRERSAHKAIGIFSYLLVPVIAVTSVGVMLKQFDERSLQHVGRVENLEALYVSCGELVLFCAFYGLAVLYRRNVALHMRYMILTGLVLVTPALARVLGYWFEIEQYPSFVITFVLIDLILAALIALDWRRRDRRRPFLIGLALSLLFHVSWFTLGHPT